MSTNNKKQSQITDQEINDYRYEKSEEQRSRLMYDFEQNFMLAVEYGAVDFLKRLPTESHIGKLAQKELKNIEYRTVMSITLVCRAAIRGGLNPAEAYELSELYLQKLENCTTKAEMDKLNWVMIRDFIFRVNKVRNKKRKQNYVELCRAYVIENVYSQLKVADIAEMIGINADYLSRQFSKELGLTLSQFIIKARLGAAEHHVKQGKRGIAEIADMLWFSSQSHFGEQFKKEYGLTPMQYRKKHRVIDVGSK
ncbi:MAG: AraC family transcriptional regulator [Turicibacter sp.]|nr:AraC family transcriptional regulator [Turicibacter sp.]